MVVHWDEVGTRRHAHGDVRARASRLAAAAGSRRVGCTRWRIEPGARNAPVHVHADEEEIFFVLGGDGLSWLDGHAHPVRAGDAIVHRAGGEPHTLIAGPDGLDALAFAEGSDTQLCWLPRCGVMWAGTRWLPADGPHPFAAEAAAGALEVEAAERAEARPANIAALADVPARATRRGRTDTTIRDLGRAAGSARSGLNEIVVAAGAESHPPHCHSAEEELFVVLGGSGTLRLGDEPRALRSGHVIARPPGTGIAHSFAAGPDGLRLLAYGQRDPGDVTFYPRSGKVRLRGLGPVTFRVQPVGYWDGEE